jgi:hypothetical protein
MLMVMVFGCSLDVRHAPTLPHFVIGIQTLSVCCVCWSIRSIEPTLADGAPSIFNI